MQSGSTCIMIGFRSDHACIMHKSETGWMHARGQPASARAWPAASGQLAGFHFASARVLGIPRAIETVQARANAMGTVPISISDSRSHSGVPRR